MDIITKTGEIWSENAIGAVISLIKESDDSIEAERKLTHWLTKMNGKLSVKFYSVGEFSRNNKRGKPPLEDLLLLWRDDLCPKTSAERWEELLSPGPQNGL